MKLYMIDYLRGTLIDASLTRIVVEAGGVGYDLNISLNTYDRLPKVGSEFYILAHLVHRDDRMTLYGFVHEDERELFRLLIGISGIGPKVALSILSGISVVNFKDAVSRGDVNILKTVKGIGPKTASRIMVELKEKIDLAPTYEKLAKELAASPEQQLLSEAVLALISLGYNQAQAHKAIKTVLDDAGKELLPVEEIIKGALKNV